VVLYQNTLGPLGVKFSSASIQCAYGSDMVMNKEFQNYSICGHVILVIS
jgi:hypothetical protein